MGDFQVNIPIVSFNSTGMKLVVTIVMRDSEK